MNLYRHWSLDGKLLYIGISLSAITRLRSHKKSRWFDEIAKVTIEKYPNEALAREAEIKAIQEERPLHNISYHPDRPPRQNISFLTKIGTKMKLSAKAATSGVNLSTYLHNLATKEANA